jgi:ATP-binding cassette subfamily B protein
MKDNTIKWLSSVTGKHKLKILLLAVLEMILGGSSVFYAMLLQKTIDGAAEKERSSFVFYLTAIIILVMVQIMLRSAVRHIEEASRSTIENIFKSRLFEVLLKKDYAAVTDTHSGEWLNRLTSDTQVTANGMVEILPGILGMAVKMIGALVMLLIIEPKFLYVLIPSGAALIVLTYAFRKVLKRQHKSIQEQDGNLRIFLQERLGSMMIVRTFSAERQSKEQADMKMQAHKNARMKRNSFSNICNIGFSAAMNGMYLLGLGYCGIGIIGGTVSYGTLTAVLQLIGQIQSPFANITGYLPKFYAMTASAERLREAERFADDCPSEPKTKSEIKQFYESDFSAISLENICFTYKSNDRESVLQDLNLIIRKGENIAFTGHSGCGKSTVLKLIMCLYHAEGGEMVLKTNNSPDIPLTSEWHRLFAYVPQGNQLMSGTIREVVTFGSEERMQEQDAINRALKISCSDEFVSQLENGIDTVLGERGAGLSEGQMQRLAIARAIFSDNPVLLLDEATSSLDESTEKQVLENIRTMTDKTVIIVTHRPKALELCDRVVQFSNGGIN